jgi:hypothetical protein
MNAGKKRQNGLPKNVHWDASRGLYVVWVAAYKKRQFVGRFANVSDAEEAAARMRQQMHAEFSHTGDAHAA